MDSILYWNAVALEANRLSHTLSGGEQTGPTLSSRAIAIVHLAMHDAFFGVTGGQAAYCPLPAGGPAPGTNAAAAVASAACTALSALYPTQRLAFEQAVSSAAIPSASADVSGAFGREVADHIVARLAIKASEPGASDKGYSASFAHGRHRQDPDNPTLGFHGPFYGETAGRIAVTMEHTLNAPYYPDSGSPEYSAAHAEVLQKGGAPEQSTTTRTPLETLIGLYWAYDGASQIGTPPRLYNQIIRTIAVQRGNTESQNARLFALANAAMGDAGIFAWKEKYSHDLWRPVLGVREHDSSMGPTATPANALAVDCDPCWLPLGAPRTNEPKKSFTPPFPAYPSGHATFGAAAFQIVRRFYDASLQPPNTQVPDTIAFDFVSDELNGSSVDARGTVRTRHVRHFDSLWQAIFENAISRVYLGVHWHFDAFDASDVQDGNGRYKDPSTIIYSKQIGGVKLGLDIADDIFDSGLICAQAQPAVATTNSLKTDVNVQLTNYSKI